MIAQIRRHGKQRGQKRSDLKKKRKKQAVNLLKFYKKDIINL